MINRIQIILYKLSCISPICLVLGIILYTQNFNIIFCLLLGIAGIGGGIYAFIFMRQCEEKLPILKITTDSVSQEDTSVLAYFATYLIPIIGIIWKENLLVWIIIAIGVIALGIKVSNLGFCPVLLLGGYHCYKAELSTGTECILISRKKGIRSSKKLNQVIRISDTLMLEKMGGKANV